MKLIFVAQHSAMPRKPFTENDKVHNYKAHSLNYPCMARESVSEMRPLSAIILLSPVCTRGKR